MEDGSWLRNLVFPGWYPFAWSRVFSVSIGYVNDTDTLHATNPARKLASKAPQLRHNRGKRTAKKVPSTKKEPRKIVAACDGQYKVVDLPGKKRNLRNVNTNSLNT